MTMSQSWSWVREPHYKSTHELIRLLVDVVAKGGNFLLNVGPSPAGSLDAEAYERLAGIGRWMKINGEAIHGTRPIAPHAEGPLRFTRNPKTGVVYVLYLAESAEEIPPARIVLEGLHPAAGSAVRWLANGEELSWERIGGRVFITVPQEVRAGPESRHAWVVEVERIESETAR